MFKLIFSIMNFALAALIIIMLIEMFIKGDSMSGFGRFVWIVLPISLSWQGFDYYREYKKLKKVAEVFRGGLSNRK